MSKPSRFPDTLVLIFGLIILAQLLTYVLPAGEYVREPDPARGKALEEKKEGPPLRERLQAARAANGVTPKQFADVLVVSERTVRRWEAGPEHDGVQIETTVGGLIEQWIATQRPPSADAIQAWKGSIGGKQLLIRGSYHEIDAVPLPIYHVFTAIPRGLTKPDAVEIIIFVFLIGGVIGMMRATGAFDALISAAIRAFGKNSNLLIVGTITLFAIGSGMIGMAEEYVPFIALLVTMSLAMGLDALVGISIVFVGYAVGYGCAPVNPFTVIIAQNIADIPATSGMLYRIALMAVCLAVGIHHVLRYGGKIRKDPAQSLVADIDYSSGYSLPDDVFLTTRRLAVLLAFAATVIMFVIGVKLWDWYLTEMSAIFLALGFLTPILGGLSPNAAAKKFCEGAGELTTTALLIGFARTIEVTLVDGHIIDTVVHGIAGTLSGLGESAGAVGMLLTQTLCNFFIPSGSGQAYVTMPIMAPLADELGIERQVAVLAYQFGDGFTNVITPTNAAFMGMLAMARVPYERWLRFAIPLMIKLYLIATIALVIAVQIGYS